MIITQQTYKINILHFFRGITEGFVTNNKIPMKKFILLIILFTIKAFIPRLTGRNRHFNIPSLHSTIENDCDFDENDVLNYKYEPKNDEENHIYSLFLEQISEQIQPKTSRTMIPTIRPSRGRLNSDRTIKFRNVVETPTALVKGYPIELIYKKKVIFGNFESYKDETNAIYVLLQSGETVTVDVGQVVSVWDTLADEETPVGPDNWAEVAADALDLLGSTSPRKSDLEEFWNAVSRRRTNLAVDSLDLGIYIFQEYGFRRWIDPYNAGTESHVQALSAAQRYAAALLLHFDDFHFKRRASIHISGSGSQGLLIEGGYRAVDSSVVIHRQGTLFLENYERKTGKILESTDASYSARAGLLRLQRAIEAYAVAPQSLSPSPVVKHILKRLGLPYTPAGAQILLKNLSSIGFSVNHQLNTTTATISSDKKYLEITPWIEGVLTAANQLTEMIRNRRNQLNDIPILRSGKRIPNGRMDYRGSTDHPVICLDPNRASFFDDGFSLSPATGELLIHISDVTEYLRKFPLLLETARERISSTFTSQGPLHMLPPQILDSLKLDPNGPNEAITVALSVNFDTGRLIGYRIFPSILPPIIPMDIDRANEILSANAASIPLPYTLNYPLEAIKDVITTQQLIQRIILTNPWIDAHYSRVAGGSGRETVLNKLTGKYLYGSAEKTPISQLVNALLTLYSNSSVMFCLKQGLNVPIAWENRDRTNPDLVRRFATQPLRNWLSQVFHSIILYISVIFLMCGSTCIF